MRKLFLPLLLVTACSVTGEQGDGEHDDFLVDGKADAFGLAEDSPEAAGVLLLVNSSEYDDFKAMGITTRSARNLDDAGDVQSLAALDAIPWVGPRTFKALLAGAREQGLTHLTDCVLGEGTSQMLEADWLTHGEEIELRDPGAVPAAIKRQILAGMVPYVEGPVTWSKAWAAAAGGISGEGAFYYYDVKEPASGKAFRLITLLPSEGDGAVGFAFEGDTTRVVATYTDGTADTCRVGKQR